MAVILDLKEGSFLEDTTQGFRAARACVVTDIVAAPDVILKTALDTAGVPQEGDPYPGITVIEVVRRTARALACKKVSIICEYAPPGASSLSLENTTPDNNGDGFKRISSTTVSERRNTDHQGNPITVLPPSAGHDQDFFDQLEDKEPQPGVADGVRAEHVISFQRHEVDPPQQRGQDFVGKLNTAGVGPYAAKTLLCINVTGVTVNLGTSYQVDYEFVYRPDGWDQVFEWIDTRRRVPLTDSQHEDTVSRKVVQIIGDTAYAPLNLDFTV